MATALHFLAFSADLRSSEAVPSNPECFRHVLACGHSFTALLASAMAFFTWWLRRDRLPFLAGLALLGSAILSGLGVVLAGLPGAPNEEVLFRSSLASGPVEACLLGAAGFYFMAQSAPARWGAALLGLAALGLGISWTSFPADRGGSGGLFRSAFAFGGIFVFLANGVVYLRLRKERPGPIAQTLLICLLLQVAAHVSLVIAPPALSLGVAHVLRGTTFLVLLGGLLGETAAAFAVREKSFQEVLGENRALKERQAREALPLKGLDAKEVQAVEKWASRLAHDVKSPIASISMGVDYLLRHCPRGDETNVVLDEIKGAVAKTHSIMKALGSPLEERAGEEDVQKG